MISIDWHFPWTIHVGTHALLVHTVCEFLAFFIGFRYYLWLRKKQGDHIDSNNRLWILIGAIAGAIIGSRLVGGLESISQLRTAPNKWMHFYGNKSVVGGFLGGLFGVETVKKLIGEKSRSGDLYVYPMLLALLIGRIGCISMGIYEDVYGVPTSFFMGMNLGDGIHRHPLMVYEIIFLILLWITLKHISKKYILPSGMPFQLFMIGYLAFRLVVELLKKREVYFCGLGAIQIACVLGLLYYGKTIVNIFRNGFAARQSLADLSAG